MSEKGKQELRDFGGIVRFLCKLNEDKKDIYQELNQFVLKYLNKNPITTISPEQDHQPFTKNDNSAKTFLKRAVYAFFNEKQNEFNIKLLNNFDVESPLAYLTGEYNGWKCCRFLTVKTTKEIFSCLKNYWDTKGDFSSISSYPAVFGQIKQWCKNTMADEEQNKQKNRIFPLDLVIGCTVVEFALPENDIIEIYPFIDMNKENFLNKDIIFRDNEIYCFLDKIPLEYVEKFLQDKDFVEALGGLERLKGLLEIEKLERSNNEKAMNLAKKLHNRCQKIDFSKAKITDEGEKTGIEINHDKDYEQKVKRVLAIYQLSKSLASAFIFLFGVGLLFAAGFAWSVTFLLGIGFIIPSIVAFVNSILCMRPTKTKTWLAKIFKNCAWIVDGALLITLGAVFCAGPLAIGFIVFGSLGILMGCFNAFVGTLNSMWDTQREITDYNSATSIEYIKPEILSYKIFTLVVFAVAFAAGVLLALNPAILPIALPFLPAIGIGIAALSGLGVIKSALRLFYDDTSDWQVGFYHAAKYIKAGMFVLGGFGLIALPFLPIAAALASVIGMPTLVVNIFSFLVGLASGAKGCILVTRMSSKIEFLLAGKAMDKAYDFNLPESPINVNGWKNEMYDNQPSEPGLEFGDIGKNAFECIFPE